MSTTTTPTPTKRVTLKPIPVRLSTDLIAALDAEAARRDLPNRSEVIRQACTDFINLRKEQN